MGLRITAWGILCSLAQSQFFTPSFALSALPIQLSFPTGFVSQSLLPLSAMTLPPPPKTSKKSNPGVYNPFPSARDPAADQGLTNLVTSFNDKPISGKKEAQAKLLFDQDSFRSFNIEMEPQNIAIMTQDPTKELKVHCRLTADYNTANAQVFNDFGVGCGYKGSVGSLRVCLDENQRDNHICRKLSIRVDARAFKSITPNSTKAPLFYGMRSLMFSGLAVDLSMMSERTSYYLMSTLGIKGPLATHAKLFLNGKYLGVYGFVQAVDQEFTEIHWRKDDRKGKGALYKELWFNPVHMQTLADMHQGGDKTDESFMREVMSAIQSTPLIGNSPQQFFDQYFDEKSFIDMIAFNSLVGNSDDWRQRHNFFIYVKQDGGTKKLVWIPWDYDRLYDSGSDTRGALKGKAWWDISVTATPAACNQQMKSAHQQALELGGTPAKIAWNRGIFEQFPLDINVPVTCDKLTQLMAHALASKVRKRTRELATRIDMNQIRAKWNVWNAQIKTALEKDPSGPAVAIMLAQQKQLDQHLTTSIQKAVNQANLVDGISSIGTSSFSTAGISTLPAFAPKSTTFPASSTTFAPVSSFTPKFQPATSTSFSSSVSARSFPSSFAPASTFAPPSTLSGTFSFPTVSVGGVIG